MKRHQQLLRHDPDNDQMGDCFRTVIACLLDMRPDQVPHFMADSKTEMPEVWCDVDRWLLEHGYRFVDFPMQTNDLGGWLKQMQAAWPDLRWILSGGSPRGTDHCVIIEGGRITHDPHPDGGGIVEPDSTGHFWMGFLLPVALHGHRRKFDEHAASVVEVAR